MGAAPVCAKEAPITAIILYDGVDGASYAQVTGFTIAGKVEVRQCDGSTNITKKNYGKLAKVALKRASSLERTKDGVLMLTVESASFCILPGSLKFDSNEEMTSAQAADHAALEGTVIPNSEKNGGGNLPALNPGVKIIFVAAPDLELAEYLRAQRAHSMAIWREYLSKYSSSPHAADARQIFAGLTVDYAQAAYSTYKGSATSLAPEFGQLKLAHDQAELALKIVSDHTLARALLDYVRHDLTLLVENNRKELEAYRKAVREQTPGYSLLAEAQLNLEHAIEIDPKLDSAIALKSEMDQESSQIENTIKGAQALFAAGKFEDSARALLPYRCFAPEVPRIGALIENIYMLHYDKGHNLAEQQKWEEAATEYRKALDVKTSVEAKAALDDADKHIIENRDQVAADSAIRQSAGLAEQKQLIQAYLILADLPEGPRALVANEIAARKADFVTAAVERVQKLQELHSPIRGRADEEGMKEAYNLLQRASSLTDDQSVKLTLDLLSDNISSYYVEQARKYFAKPMGSGVGLGWYYLSAAQHYRPELEAVHDERNRYSGDYQVRSRLSIGIEFRDQTSRRESAGLADQLADAVATGLEASYFVKVIRHPGQTGGIPPNFTFVGEILQHRQITEPLQETLQSKYRAGTREVKNEAWVKTSHEYELAKEDLAAAQQALTLAQGRNRKKEIAAASERVSKAQKLVEEARLKFDVVESTVPEDVIKPYNYTKTKFDVSAVIELQFRIVDQNGNMIEPAVPFKQNKSRSYVVLENVKPEDTESIKIQDKHPDPEQILTDLEIEARDQLIKLAQEKVAAIPEKILNDARRRASSNDLDGAAEQYILYLNCTAHTDSPTRDEATKFLRDRFNVAFEPVS